MTGRKTSRWAVVVDQSKGEKRDGVAAVGSTGVKWRLGGALFAVAGGIGHGKVKGRSECDRAVDL